MRITRVGVKDELLDAQTLRVIGAAPYGGADVGECLASARRVDGTDPSSWYDEWTWTADAVLKLAEDAHVLAFDGPGQGRALLEQGLVLRPDFENVLTPIADYALTRGDVDPEKVVVIGLSLGFFLAARAVSAEHRALAMLLVARILALLERKPTAGWALRRGQQVHGARKCGWATQGMGDCTLQARRTDHLPDTRLPCRGRRHRRLCTRALCGIAVRKRAD